MNDDTTVLFEVSWEVCRQVGGIYTVLRSKAAAMTELWGDRYCLIGPYTSQTTPIEFEPVEPAPILGPAVARARERGVAVRFGRWLIGGYPKVLLFDYLPHFGRLDAERQRVWDELGIPAPPDDAETNDAIVFGSLVAEFVEDFTSDLPKGARVIGHFHEWMASLALPLMRVRKVPIATVLTTHATLLGRYVCAEHRDFYQRLPHIDVDRASGSRGIYQRYCIERAAAHGAHVLTTVSHITAEETEHLLKRRPDVIVPNGLRVDNLAALHEFQNLHAHYKERIHDFVRGHFFGSYEFDLDETLYFILAGRYEYRNKGIDLFIESLYRLNRMLRDAGSERTIVAFIVTSAPTKQMNAEVLRSHFMLEELRRVCEEITERVGDRMFESVARGRMPDPTTLLSNEDTVLLKRMMYSRTRGGPPTVVTHDMRHDDSDAILGHLRHRGLFNAEHDRVKVVYHPEFVSSTNPLFGLDYDQFVRGCHLGVFPSYYEPWGYTPAECTVLGVPSVCSNLSGFGTFIQERLEDHNRRGLFVIDRRHLDDEGAIGQLTQVLFDFSGLNRRQRIALRNKTERVSELLDWSELIENYKTAWDMALSRAYDGLIPEGP